MTGARFSRGDYLRVTVKDAIRVGQAKPKSVFFGTALEDRDYTGAADFTLEVAINTQHGVIDIPFNLNQVDVELLFVADVAREREVERS